MPEKGAQQNAKRSFNLNSEKIFVTGLVRTAK